MNHSNEKPKWMQGISDEQIIVEILERYLAGTLHEDLQWKRDN